MKLLITITRICKQACVTFKQIFLHHLPCELSKFFIKFKYFDIKRSILKHFFNDGSLNQVDEDKIFSKSLKGTKWIMGNFYNPMLPNYSIYIYSFHSFKSKQASLFAQVFKLYKTWFCFNFRYAFFPKNIKGQTLLRIFQKYTVDPIYNPIFGVSSKAF